MNGLKKLQRLGHVPYLFLKKIFLNLRETHILQNIYCTKSDSLFAYHLKIFMETLECNCGCKTCQGGRGHWTVNYTMSNLSKTLGSFDELCLARYKISTKEFDLHKK